MFLTLLLQSEYRSKCLIAHAFFFLFPYMFQCVEDLRGDSELAKNANYPELSTRHAPVERLDVSPKLESSKKIRVALKF